jgi:hypothetical protein
MIQWTVENAYYFAAIYSAIFLIIIYFLFLRNLK